MGVPALFRFLQRKYPKIIVPVIEEDTQAEETREDCALDMSGPNPNGVEYDNLYLDMNGIVHPCTHPEGKPAPETEEDMMVEIFSYTERVVNMVRPRKLLFMAIDGVAPRAKMNQQRSRRFRSARDAEQAAEDLKEAIAEWEAMGHTVSDSIKNRKSWDSNAITPGTPFMSLLAASLRYWVARKLNQDPGWANLQVIISDASVPGEGEHKIMDWIRRQRVSPGYNPNTRHVIYGLDADLIMLALATHEPYFSVLREDVFGDARKKGCHSCGRTGHQASQCTSAMKYNLDGLRPPPNPESSDKKPFIFLDVSILRECLEIALNNPRLPFPFDLEKAIDDWIFLIFFVGNDFLPHLPSLDIRQGGIDTLLNIWKTELPRMGGYVTNNGHLNQGRVQMILDGLARQESDIFRRMHEDEERQKEREAQRNPSTRPSVASIPVAKLHSLPATPAPGNRPPFLPPRPNFDMFASAVEAQIHSSSPATANDTTVPSHGLAESNSDVVRNRKAIRLANMSAAEALKAELHGLTALGRNPLEIPSPVLDFVKEQSSVSNLMNVEEQTVPAPSSTVDLLSQDIPEPRGTKRKVDEVDLDELSVPSNDSQEEMPPPAKRTKTEEHDDIKLWTPGYQARYYKSKFEVDYDDLNFRKRVTNCYVEGLSWVLHYYYQGTPSWQWFYPFHYAPFAGDFDDVEHMAVRFRIGQPFKPFEQLMSVFPPASRQHIPKVYHPLMMDGSSPILDFYPLDFEIDQNGKSQSWMGIALLPFIEETRLQDAMKPSTSHLTEEEKRRNTWGSSSLTVGNQHPMYNFLCGLYKKGRKPEAVPIDVVLSRGLAGSVLRDPSQVPDSTYSSPLGSIGLPDIPNDRSLSVFYFFPKQTSPHQSILLAGVERPPRTLDQSDVDFTASGREHNPNRRDRGPTRDNNFAVASGLGRGSMGYRNGLGYGGYGPGGYREEPHDARRSSNYGSNYGSRPLSDRPVRSAYDTTSGPPSKWGPVQDAYGLPVLPPPGLPRGSHNGYY